jgi:transposase
MLTAKGVKPIAISHQAFESTRVLRKVQAWLFGAFSPIDGKHLLVEADRCDSVFFQVFMDELSTTDSEELMLILLDNASFHKTKKLKIPDNIALIYIPPYSPELNPAEKIWQRFKRAFTNIPFTTMADVSNFLTEQTNLLSDHIIISTCAYEWVFSENIWTV